MCKMLLSINPEHINNIFIGSKRFEFRKTICKKDVDTIVFYATNPIKKVVGEANVRNILIDTPEKIWELTSEFSGISKYFFEEYYKNKKNAVAFQIDHVLKYQKPKTLEELGIYRAPQSFQYL
ncbi:MAG: hypothetical protein ACPKMZ_08465 [Pleomorphochaeta sp.]